MPLLSKLVSKKFVVVVTDSVRLVQDMKGNITAGGEMLYSLDLGSLAIRGSVTGDRETRGTQSYRHEER